MIIFGTQKQHRTRNLIKLIQNIEAINAFYKNDKIKKSSNESDEVVSTRYYDGVNFARLITDRQQGWFSFGYCDDVVPPTTAYATYNTVKGPKQLSPYQATWHFWFQEQWDEWENWLIEKLRK